MSKEEISQELFANLAAGGDILELRETFDENEVCCLYKTHKSKGILFPFLVEYLCKSTWLQELICFR